MPVDTQHADYVAQASTWQYMRRVVGGQRQVHLAGEAMLARLVDETDANYEARKSRATFFNATWRTIEGLAGMLFLTPPEVKVSPVTEPMLLDVTKAGEDLPTVAARVAFELLEVGRFGLFVDHPVAPREGMTTAEVELLNLRPHIAKYPAEAITNWDYKWVNNKTTLCLVVLVENHVEDDPLDEFKKTSEMRWRVLDLFNGEYRQRVFHKAAGKDEQIGVDLFPEMRGKRMHEIPFEFFGDGLPPLEDLANVNVSHYHTTADLEHGAHKTALPQPWVTGVQMTIDPVSGAAIQPKLYMGGGHAWSFPNAEAKVGMLEYTGTGLAALETRLAAKEAQMAVLGARMLEQQKKAQEAAETAGIHRSGEQASLSSYARLISRGMRRVVGWFDSWAGGTGAVEVAINEDFFPRRMTPEELTARVAAWQQGAMSKEALFEQLQDGGVISDARDFETEEAKIANAAPALLAQASAAPEDKGDPPGK